MSRERVTLLGMDESELTELVTGEGEPSFRARQLTAWLYSRLAVDFDEMTDISKRFRIRLKEFCTIGSLKVVDRKESSDGAIKYLYRAGDGARFESMYLPEARRTTICLSTQVGCALDCKFCATGRMGFVRDLTAGEIIEQIIHTARDTGGLPSNVVLMGMGEPLLNYEATAKAIGLMNTERGLQIGRRRMTLSTVGIVPGIDRLAGEDIGIGLALSLNFPTDKLRERYMPINRKYPLGSLVEALKRYQKTTRRRNTLEYVMIEGVNLGPKQASELGSMARLMGAKINLIPYNPVPGFDFQSPTAAEVERFAGALYEVYPNITVRDSRGKDIQGACGQLAAGETGPKRTKPGGKSPAG
ncbi:23S rRNA (adenine(2503)-C(2))-methyltransferase RlmN [candidate division KSB1 bacterium]